MMNLLLFLEKTECLRSLLSIGSALCILLFIHGQGLGQDQTEVRDRATRIDLSNLFDSTLWKIIHSTAETADSDGKQGVRLTSRGDSADGIIGLAIPVEAVFRSGIIEVDLKGKNVRQESFLGIAFNIVDEKHFEAIYFRPFNFRADGAFRIRAVQYLAWPENTWDKLRKEHPGKFEGPVQPTPDPDGWFHARIEVDPKRVRVFVDDGTDPSLTIDRLVDGNELRPIGLFVDVADGLYSNLRITPKD